VIASSPLHVRSCSSIGAPSGSAPRYSLSLAAPCVLPKVWPSAISATVSYVTRRAERQARSGRRRAGHPRDVQADGDERRIDRSHLHGAERILKIPVAAVAFILEPLAFGAPVDVPVGLPPVTVRVRAGLAPDGALVFSCHVRRDPSRLRHWLRVILRLGSRGCRPSLPSAVLIVVGSVKLPATNSRSTGGTCRTSRPQFSVSADRRSHPRCSGR
jgi:hypothetical protein